MCNQTSIYKIFFRKLKSFRNLKFRDKSLLLEAYILTGFIRIMILFVPFRNIYKQLGNINVESPYEIDENERIIVKRIKKSILMASKNTPWNSKCLIKAITAQHMLKRRNISATIYLGVKKEEEVELKAHSWIRCGNVIVTGGEYKDEYTIISKVSNYEKF